MASVADSSDPRMDCSGNVSALYGRFNVIVRTSGFHTSDHAGRNELVRTDGWHWERASDVTKASRPRANRWVIEAINSVEQ